MPTKILILETPNFQLGANAGPDAEKIDPFAFPVRVKKHHEQNNADTIFVMAPAEQRSQLPVAELISGPASVSLGFFPCTEDAIRFLPSILLFAGTERTQGIKDYLQEGAVIYSDSFFSGRGIGARTDQAFAFAVERLGTAAATRAWGALQSLISVGLQQLPESQDSGEKLDLQIGADEKFFALCARFPLGKGGLDALRDNSALALPASYAGVFETRYLADSGKAELCCLFYRNPAFAPAKPIEIRSWQKVTALEDAGRVSRFQFRTLQELNPAVPEEKRKLRGGFQKKFSDQVKESSPLGEDAIQTTVKGGGSAPNQLSVISPDSGPPVDSVTIFKNEGAAARVLELEAKLKALESQLKTREEALSAASRDANDPLKKRDVLTNIKDSQSEGLKQTVKLLEEEIAEGKQREKELMKMVDKAVQMKDEAAKRIKELDMKLKQASGGKGSRETMLEKQLEEQKRQNKELSAKVSDLSAKLKAA